MIRRRALFQLEIRAPQDAANRVAAWLVEQGAGGAVQEDFPPEARLLAYGADRARLARLGAAIGQRLRLEGTPCRVTVRPAKAALASWETEWMRHLRPVRISRSLTLWPMTAPMPAATRGVVVRLAPSMAFGFGDHPTTRLAAAAVERACLRGAARRVLDLGTGSGGLALVAARSGAARVVGLDIDRRAVRAARANAALNRVKTRCRFSTAPLSRLRARFDLVVANVDLATILELAPVMAARLSPGATLLLTGILTEDAPDVARSYRALGLSRPRRADREGWVLLSMRRGDGQLR